MSNSGSLASSSYPPVIRMDQQLLKACTKGDLSLYNLSDANPNNLLATTPYSNNCLHIAAMLGHDEFAKEVWSKAPSLLSGTNDDGETPLIAALMAANERLASEIVTAMLNHDLEEGRPLNCMLLKADRRKENALHHAMRNGFQDFAVELLDKEPRLSVQVTNTDESPMYIAARRGYLTIVERLLKISFSANSGPSKQSALHAATTYRHTDIVKQLLKGRPQLAYHKDRDGNNPLVTAILYNNLELVKIFLEFDHNLAYHKIGEEQTTPFMIAITKGYVSIAEEIISTCPDSAYSPDSNGDSALIQTVLFGQPDLVDYILTKPQLRRLINQANNNGELPLHHAASKCDPKLLRSLLSHAGQDYTAVSVNNIDAATLVYEKTDLWKTLKWNESFTLVLNAIPVGWKSIIRDHFKKTIKEQAFQEVESLTSKYISNTSVVAALLATITFAAAFTLPGGFNSDPANAGLPIFARKAAFQVFLISDTIAMCSSLSVSFLCILATWKDLDFLLNYRKTTRTLMWCAYMATTVAFGTGLFTVIAPNNLWLAILILVFCTLLPLFSKIIGDWPLLMLCYRLRGPFEKDLVPII